MVHSDAVPTSRSRTFWAKPLIPILILSVILAAVAGALVYIQDQSAGEYRAAIENHRLELKAYDIMAAGWRAVLGNSFPPELAPDPEFARVEAAASVAALQEIMADYEANWAGRGPLEVRSLLAEYAANHVQALDLIVEGRGFDAFPVLGESLLLFEDLRLAASTSTASALSSAESTHTYSHYGSVGVLALAFLAITGLTIIYRGADRRLRASAAQHEIVRLSEARFRPLVESSSDLITVVDAEGLVQFASPAVQKMVGISPEAAIGTPILDFVTPSDAKTLSNFLAQVKGRPGYTASAELKLHSRTPPHAAYSIQIVCTNHFDNPDVNGLVLNIRDISERKQLEEQLVHQAFHDSLTGLANRLRFVDRLDHAIELAKRDAKKKISVLYMDLDYFKNVNDDMGHGAGDSLLREVANRILTCIRASDTAARLGGDEFAVLLEDHHGANDARNTADRILEQIKKPFLIANREVFVSASIGVVETDPSAMTSDDVIRDADVAMYDAKENGRGRVQVFEAGMQLSLVERLALTNELNGSIDRNELVVLYQPTLYLEDERVAGFEALVRWQHPTRGLLAPSEFITLAEDTGFIHNLGRFVLGQACRQAKAWQEAYPELIGVTMSVNVSARQIQKAGFVEIVEEALLDSGLNPLSLILEITESVLIKQPQDVIGTLERIKLLGVQIALDDFGTGYSSLSYLKRFPIDILKIDRSFIDSMNATDRDKMLVQTVIDLGRMLRLEIVAEGIERREQLSSLKDLQCDMGQGFLFAHALNIEDAGELLRQQVLVLPPAPAHLDGTGNGSEPATSVA